MIEGAKITILSLNKVPLNILVLTRFIIDKESAHCIHGVFVVILGAVIFLCSYILLVTNFFLSFLQIICIV